MTTKPRLLLHSCCAPCSSAVLERLLPDFDVTVFYYNPNIFPAQEYQKRLAEQKAFLKKLGVPIIEGDYNSTEYYFAIQGKENLPEKSPRCYECYRFRLAKTAEVARANNFDFFTTTLSISPHKNADWLNQIGESLSTPQTKFLTANFKKQNGYLRSLELSKIHNFYRQNYCGCQMSHAAYLNKLENPPKV